MTDDDRMDRARRIREMREGGRSGSSEEKSDDDESVTDADADADGEAGVADPIEHSETTDVTEATDTTPESEATDTENTAMTDTENTAMTDTVESADDPDEQSSGISAPLPETDELEAALDDAGADSEAEAVGPDIDREGEETQGSGEETRVLEFTLDDEHFCLDIEYIEEIVKKETITRVPNTPEFVEGVVDLRGQITTILNPKVTLEKENNEAGDLIIVFDAESFDDQGYVGWVVDDVRQVSPITDAEVNEPPMADDHINGVIDREGEEEFVIWTTPELTMQDDVES